MTMLDDHLAEHAERLAIPDTPMSRRRSLGHFARTGHHVEGYRVATSEPGIFRDVLTSCTD